MRTRRFIVALALIAAGTTILYARKNNDQWLQESFDKWTVKDVRTILQKSPWAQTKGFRGQINGAHGTVNDMGGGGNATGTMGTAGATLGTDVTNYEFTIVFFSSLPVREAYVRMFQIENHYDSMSPAKQTAFNQNPSVDALLHGDVSQEVMVNLSFHTNDPIGQRNLTRWFDTQTVDSLKQNAYLYANKTQIQLAKYIPPSQSHGFGARFIFPRVVNGEPILSSPNGKLRFQLSWVPGPNQSVYIDFKPEEMTYQGKLSY